MAAAHFPSEELDDEFLTCSVCENIYDDPRLLPCLHTFCARCLEQWRKRHSQFTCPTCRHQVSLQGADLSSLPPNFFMNKLLDFRALQNSDETHAQCQMCESGARVEGICGDCHFLLCKNCLTGHDNSPALKDHYIITLHGLKNPNSRAKYTRAEYCPKHTDQRMTFYCQPCTKLVCRDCTIAEHRPGPNHDPQEVSKAAQECKEKLQTLVGKTKDVAEALTKTSNTIGKELNSITTNCEREMKTAKDHFAQLRAKLDKAEQEVTDKIMCMEKSQKEPLQKEREGVKETLKSTEDGLNVCTDILARGNDVEILTLRQQLEDKLNRLTANQFQHEALKSQISFHPTTGLFKPLVSLTCKPIVMTDDPVECLPTTIIVIPNTGQVCETNPQVTVTSPGGQCVKIDTIRTSGGVFEAVWRPQTSGEHVVGVTKGGMGFLCSPLTVDVGSNNPVLRFGQKGSQQGQFDTPIDVAVRGDRLYVADTMNQRIQEFDLSGNFCSSFSTSTKPGSLAVQEHGTIVVRSNKEVKKFSPTGELLHKFPLGEYCTNPYSLAVQRDGKVVLADPDKHSIFLFDADGTLVRQVGGQGQREGQFNRPCFVRVDDYDNIIVADRLNHRVQMFDKDLTFKQKFGQKGSRPQDLWGPMGVSADNRGNIVLVHMGGSTHGFKQGRKLQVFRPDGNWVSTISSDGDKLNRHHGVAVTEDGHVFVADAFDNCIRKYRYM